jgi:hypothetical protein
LQQNLFSFGRPTCQDPVNNCSGVAEANASILTHKLLQRIAPHVWIEEEHGKSCPRSWAAVDKPQFPLQASKQHHSPGGNHFSLIC